METLLLLLLLFNVALCDEIYTVTWNFPSTNASGSMPIGNGDIGASVWVDDEKLSFYISKTDSFDENENILKVGLVELYLDPNPFSDHQFTQILSMKNGTISVICGDASQKVTIDIWVAIDNPAIIVEVNSDQQITATAYLTIWRTEKTPVQSHWMTVIYCNTTYYYPDTVVPSNNDEIIWYHRNEPENCLFYKSVLMQQGLESLLEKYPDPSENVTFGGILFGTGFNKINDTSLSTSSPTNHFILTTLVFRNITNSPDEWLAQVQEIKEQFTSQSLDYWRQEMLTWWSNFWNRSYIEIESQDSRYRDDAFLVSTIQAIQRFVTACQGKGGLPIKFNGGIFNSDPERWGSPFWFQNTRLPYWNMLESGDYDFAKSAYDFYLNSIPFLEERTKIYFNHSGAFFPETIILRGLWVPGGYGFGCLNSNSTLPRNTYIRYYYQGALELVMIMLDHYDHTQDPELVQNYILPFAYSVTRFYFEHFPLRDQNDNIIFFPSQSLETWQCPHFNNCVTNPLPDISAFNRILPRLLNLPFLNEEQVSLWKQLYASLPDMPIGVKNESTVLLPAEKLSSPPMNVENTELYAVHPYRIYGVGKPDISIALNTYQIRLFPCNVGFFYLSNFFSPKSWCQDLMDAALLGMAEDAQSMVIERCKNSPAAGWRFPGFTGPFQDYIPNEDHLNNMKTGLQYMLIQPLDDENYSILLFPAWPETWDVKFKLHAALNTTIEASCQGGVLEYMYVSPASRRKDIILAGNTCNQDPEESFY